VKPAYLVFSSALEPRLDVVAWDGQAQRFFSTRLAQVDPPGDGDAPSGVTTGAARIRVTPAKEPAGERVLSVRPRDAADMALAEEAEARAGGGGLVLLARRCHSVWLVTREEEDDRLALRLAMVLASVVLGPILDARGPELFGVKTARAKLE
jgi:hypothetical protein